MIIKAVVGAGYGDEGKGLTTDFFCNKETLNIKVNGGAQAGHTVCRMVKDNNSKIKYKHWVFKQYGSGTFAGADTMLAETFMLNIKELLTERDMLKVIYNQHNKVYIDKNCRVTLPIHIILNQYVEDSRDNRHGSCGLGIYETFHMNNDVEKVSLRNIIDWFIQGGEERLLEELNRVSIKYLDYRRQELANNDNIEIDDHYYELFTKEIQEKNKELQYDLVDMVKVEDIRFVESLGSVIRGNKYKTIVFECSQGLELDQYNKRNFPHLTPSNTGLLDVATIISKTDELKDSEVEAFFITRSYKTKHGAGIFVEENNEIKSAYGLYDRTNQPNEFQGTLKYGLLNTGRMKRLILEQADIFRYQTSNKLTISMVITHLDQTNDGILTTNGRIDIEEIDNKTFGLNGRILKSYGEKATDIVE